MAGATINGSTGNQYIDSRIEWSSTANASANTSSVTAALYYKRNNTGYTTEGTGTFTINIGGQTTSVTKHISITGSAWVKAVEATKTISHNSDGSKQITISATGSIPSTSLSSTSVSGTATLDTIARASTVTSAADITLGSACNVKWTPLSNAFRYKLTFSMSDLGYTTPAIHPNTTSAYIYTGYTIPLEVANKFKYKSGTMTVTLYTFSDSGATVRVGAASSKTFTVTVPDIATTKPTVSMTLEPVGSPLSSLYIQGHTKVKATITASGKYGADITYRYMTIGGTHYGQSEAYTSDYLPTSGTVSVKGTAIDSREHSQSTSIDIDVIPYSKPQIVKVSGESGVICARCDASGNLTDSGTYLKIKAKRDYSPCMSGGEQHNFCTLRYRYKKVTDSIYSSWEPLIASDNVGTDEVNSSPLLNGALVTTSSYLVQIEAFDTVGNHAPVTFTIPTESVYMHRAGSINSLGIGKYAEEPNTVDIAEDLTVKFRGGVEFLGEEWVSLGLSSAVTDSVENYGRMGNGCYYMAAAGGKHIYVAFNCSVSYKGSNVQVNLDTIPLAYRPKRNTYSICAAGGRYVARVVVNSSGNVVVSYVQNLTVSGETTSAELGWIDGYLDYWI
jgi:hypothetical protein